MPLAPCQLPDRSLKRSPSASTIQRPRVLSGPVQSAAVATTSASRPTAASATGARAIRRSTAASAALDLMRNPRTVTILRRLLSWRRHHEGSRGIGPGLHAEARRRARGVAGRPGRELASFSWGRWPTPAPGWAAIPALTGGVLLPVLLWWARPRAEALPLPGTADAIGGRAAVDLQQWLTAWSYDPPGLGPVRRRGVRRNRGGGRHRRQLPRSMRDRAADPVRRGTDVARRHHAGDPVRLDRWQAPPPPAPAPHRVTGRPSVRLRTGAGPMSRRQRCSVSRAGR